MNDGMGNSVHLYCIIQQYFYDDVRFYYQVYITYVQFTLRHWIRKGQSAAGDADRGEERGPTTHAALDAEGPAKGPRPGMTKIIN